MSGIFHHLMAYVFDPFWKYVTLLLHGNGTNGAQNNTFIDSSSNAFTITRNGTPTQGSVSPFGPDWSNYFNGSGDYLSAAANAAWQFGTGALTVEGWLYLTATPSTATAIFSTCGNSTTAPNGIMIGVLSTSIPYFIIGSSTVQTQLNGPTALSLNTWVHLAGVRSGSTMTFYVNGVSVGSSANSTNISTSEIALIGRQYSELARYFPGYISNIRVLKATALYTADFTPPTSPLTAITNTSLLTCQSNYFKDNSTNNFAITATGTPSVQRFSPFSMGSAYSTSVIGGSGYYNGSTDYLTAANNAAFAFGSGDFTVEFWMYSAQTNASSTNPALLVGHVTSGGATNTNWGIYLGFPTLAGNIAFYASDGTTFQVALGSSVTLVNNSAWNHIAVTRSGSSFYMFINGTQAATATWAGTISSTSRPLAIGFNTTSQYYNGYISNLRLVKGTALYTAAFTPPTAPLTAITNTSLLLNTINGGIYDNAMQNNLITVGNAQISTTQSKFGGASMSFNGSSSYLQGPVNTGYSFGTGNFTIEFWVYVISYTATATTVVRTASTTGWVCQFFAASANKMVFTLGVTSILTDTASPSTNTWTHFAIVRSGTTLSMYRNGTSVASATNSTAINPTTVLLVGCGGDSNNALYGLNGYIDDLRITKGVARYTANFTPPTSQFLDY